MPRRTGSGAGRTKLTIRPLMPRLWPALEDLFGSKVVCNGCWCMYPTIGNAYRRQPAARNRAAFQEMVRRGPPPGLLAFDGALAVGWCRLTPRAAVPWLDRTWRLRRVDDLPVWSVSCLYVRKGYRRRGVTSVLIAAAIRARGARRGAGGRSVSVRRRGVAERVGHRLRVDLRAGRLQDDRPPGSRAPDHAPRPQGSRPSTRATALKNV